MPEPRSALGAAFEPGRFGAGEDDAPVLLSEPPLGALWQVAGWLPSFEPAITTLLAPLGLPDTGTFSVARSAGETTVFRIAPERVLLRQRGAATLPAILASAAPEVLPVLDLGHARTVVRVEGAAAPDLLARLVNVDLHDSAMPEGGFAQTGIHEVSVLLHRLAGAGAGPRYEVYIPRSWARSVWELITVSAAPLGYHVAEHG